MGSLGGGELQPRLAAYPLRLPRAARPKLPWFKTADTFLNSVVVTRDSQSNLKSPTEECDDGQQEPISVLTEPQENEEENTEDMDYDSIAKSTVKATGTSAQENQFATPGAKKRRISKFSKVESAINKLQKIAMDRPPSSKKVVDEYELFGQHIAGQLRTLPARSSAILQEKFQSLITNEKLKYLPPDSLVTSASPYGSTSSHVSDEEEDLSNLDSALFTVDDMLHRKLQ
ncbi:uncharacterized protein LOC126419417 [Schistocerca serialis cubense]|uniref:uncharacterized protein LOC126419417 n=1 Tax=Schistocerca serialis cubense TaxID=2023355 RepID=UPI00214EB9E7|nr:uncharacterized protein LOC126419417 [Schistocerca serialis cubense]